MDEAQAGIRTHLRCLFLTLYGTEIRYLQHSCLCSWVSEGAPVQGCLWYGLEISLLERFFWET